MRTNLLAVPLGGTRELRAWIVRGQEGAAERLIVANATTSGPLWYGARIILPPSAAPALRAALEDLERAALHSVGNTREAR